MTLRRESRRGWWSSRARRNAASARGPAGRAAARARVGGARAGGGSAPRGRGRSTQRRPAQDQASWAGSKRTTRRWQRESRRRVAKWSRARTASRRRSGTGRAPRVVRRPVLRKTCSDDLRGVGRRRERGRGRNGSPRLHRTLRTRCPPSSRRRTTPHRRLHGQPSTLWSRRKAPARRRRAISASPPWGPCPPANPMPTMTQLRPPHCRVRRLRGARRRPSSWRRRAPPRSHGRPSLRGPPRPA